MRASDDEHILVHGMGRSLVEPDWTPLTDEEVAEVLRAYLPWAELDDVRPAIAWRSPRPMSAAGVVETDAGSVFMKRHHRSVRSTNDLRVEHAFAEHLRGEGAEVPAVRETSDGATTVELGEYIYEVHDLIEGSDLYRDAISWSGYSSLEHARSAGSALARFHAAARGFLFPPRLPGVLTNSSALVSASNPPVALRHLMNLRPDLANAPVARHLPEDFEHYHLDAINEVGPFLAVLEPQWGHGDWHPSNLAWSDSTPSANVAGIFDLGLANRTFALHDLALAIERSIIDWLDLANRGTIGIDFASLDAFLDGYIDVSPIRAYEEQALIALLPVVHVEYALSEVEYFAAVVGNANSAALAYDEYFIGHTRWFLEGDGESLLDYLRARFQIPGTAR
jgi:Ser/Thr protein kinase RdoA (MazF antagonist)